MVKSKMNQRKICWDWAPKVGRKKLVYNLLTVSCQYKPKKLTKLDKIQEKMLTYDKNVLHFFIIIFYYSWHITIH